MAEPKFDVLLRQVARQTSRRSAVATMLGGALLLHAPAASEATKEAERRKDHHRKQSNSAALKPISVQVRNPGTNPVTLQHGSWQSDLDLLADHCTAINTVPIPPGATLLFRSPDSVEYLWINGTYWFSFRNPFLARPHVTVAVGGSSLRFPVNCPPQGTTVLSARPLSEGHTVNIPINGQVFSVTRRRDSNYKEFTLTLPTTL
jgi:hypothetical protein